LTPLKRRVNKNMASAATPLDEVFEQCRDMDASLTERLSIFADAVCAQAPAFTAAVDRLIKRLQDSGAGDAAPQPGDVMPAFYLPDDTGRLVALQALLRAGPVAVTFHRGHWCPYCRININALAKAHDVMSREGGQIVAIMPERQEFAAEFKNDARARFPILTDMDNGYAMSLNLTIWVGEEMKRLIRDEFGHDIASFQGNDAWLLPIPATFIVGRDGRIKERFVDPDYRRCMAIVDLLTALRKEI
jgi:peroxiredoxin